MRRRRKASFQKKKKVRFQIKEQPFLVFLVVYVDVFFALVRYIKREEVVVKKYTCRP